MNPAYADTARTVRIAPDNPGVLSGTDLALCQVIERDPVCAAYRAYEVCGVGPESMEACRPPDWSARTIWRSAPVLAIGSPGGSRIIGYVAKSIIAWADWDMDVQQALSLPHLVNRFGTYDVEVDTAAEGYTDALIEIGFEVTPP